MKLKYSNLELWTKIIKEFKNKKTVGKISYEYNVKYSAIINAWNDEFGKNKVIERNNSLNGEYLNCPVCNIYKTKEEIIRHVMSSFNKGHKEFRIKQDNKIKEIFNNVYDEEFNIKYIINKYNLFCSPSYVRSIFSKMPNYRERFSKFMSLNMKEQYKIGKRNRPTKFANGMKFTRENGGKKFISEDKINKILELYKTDITQREIAKTVKCKDETVHKYLIEKFGAKEVSKRNREAKIKATSKLTNTAKEELKKDFLEAFPKKYLAEKYNVCEHVITYFFRKTFSKEERKKREKRIQRYAILKSLKSCGKKGTVGSLPENYCYKELSRLLNYKIIHHDLDICTPYEVDITIPELKIAISWDGPFHRHPIFGIKVLENNKKRDNNKINKLKKIGWKTIIIEDNCSKFSEIKVRNTVNNIINNLNNENDIIILRN